MHHSFIHSFIHSEECSPEVADGRRQRELGAMVEPLGQRAEAESGTQRLEAETRDPPATMPMETGRPAAIPPHRWWAEGEQRGCQDAATNA